MGGSLRLGILGGTFDPVHLGHLRMAEEIGEELDLEKVYMIPASRPPHKGRQSITSFHHRLEMIRLATKNAPGIEPMDIEGHRRGLSYSIETLREFHRLFGPNLKLYFLLGSDAFLEIGTWKEYESLFDYSNFVVLERPGIGKGALEHFLRHLGLKKEEGKGRYVFPSGNHLICSKGTHMQISSTAIREAVAKGRSIRFLVPESVGRYKEEKGLYRNL